MSSILTTTLLLLTAAPPTPSTSAPAPGTVRLQESLPSGFQADGKLDEWKALPPSLTLGAGSQVAGASKVSSPEDLSATVWMALGPDGLAIAGEVRDDKVLLTHKTNSINADHVEVWLALPQPKLPPMAFTNHFGEQPVPNEAACATASEEDPAKCKAWFKQQTEHRQRLQRDLVAQYGLTPQGVLRYGLPTAVGPATYTPFEGGYRFEALIPTAAFPRTAEAPLRHVQLLVDLVDSDEGSAKQETFLSSSPRRKFGDASTFHAVTLAQPLRYGKWPELLERALKAQPGASYAPGPDADALQVWVNAAVPYQFIPEAPSPDVVQVDLGTVTSLGKAGGVELVSVPASVDELGAVQRWLVSRKGQTVLQTSPVAFGEEVKVAERAPGLHVVRVYDGPLSRVGTGTCGACPVVSFTWLTMDAQGRFSKPVSLDGAGGSTGEDVAWEASPDLTRLETFDLEEGDDGKAPPKKRLAVRHTFNPGTGKYDTKSFPKPEDTGVAEDTK